MTTKPKIWLSTPEIGTEESKIVTRTLSNNLHSPDEVNVVSFEKDLCEFTGSKYAVALTSGTAAIHLSLILAGVGQGDIVLCSSFTFSASCNPIIYQKATPVFIDSENKSWNLDPKLLEIAIKDQIAEGKAPKVLILVHIYGVPAKLDEIISICKKYNIVLIEDAAEAIGSKYNDKYLGSFGDFGVFSFNINKVITTSGGGAIISDQKEKIEKAHYLATQAREKTPHYQHLAIGYNYRMSNVNAGIGRGQMLVLKERVKQRRANFDYYVEHLASIKGITFQPEPEGTFANRWLSCLTFDEPGINDEVRLALEADNIEARPLWKPMHLQPVFEKYPSYLNGVSEDLFARGLCLPSGSNLTKKDLDRVIDIIQKSV